MLNAGGGETVLKVVVPDSYDPTTAGLPCPARKSKKSIVNPMIICNLLSVNHLTLEQMIAKAR